MGLGLVFGFGLSDGCGFERSSPRPLGLAVDARLAHLFEREDEGGGEGEGEGEGEG